MKKVLKKLASAAAALTLCSTAMAADINVGGVVWNPDHPTDFDADLAFTQWFTSTGGSSAAGFAPAFADVIDPTLAFPPASYLTGVGEVTFANGKGINSSSTTGGDPASFCPGCELTYSFGGLRLSDLIPVTGGFLPIFDSSAAWLNVYVDHDFVTVGNGFNNADVVTNGQSEVDDAVDGDLWLSLSFDTFDLTFGTVLGGLTEANLSVTGGAAAGNFDTNTLNGFVSDLFAQNNAFFFGGIYANGTGDLVGDSIPAPAPLALLGLGLVALGLSRRKRSA